jgi:hypothetical protein
VPPACKGAAVAATEGASPRPAPAPAPAEAGEGAGQWAALLGGLGSLLAAGSAAAVDLPEDRAEAMYHLYDGGGVQASGPALLIRKSLADRVSLSASYYVDMVSNASIDVVTTASPFKEERTAYDLGVDYVVRDTTVSVAFSKSDEPDYIAEGVSVDLAQEVFGGMTTVSLGYTRARDQVGQRGTAGFIDTARHWQYRLGATQILSPTWLMSANVEAVSDEGFLGSPYRVARVFGAAVPERNPRTRSSRAIKLRTLVDIGGEPGAGRAVRAEYRYFWDNWDIKAHTTEVGMSRYFGEKILFDGFLRYYTQDSALFYSDNATQETEFVSRNRQLSSFTSLGVGAKASYTVARVPGRHEVKASLAYELKRFEFKDFTDIRTGRLFEFDANVLQAYVSATF